ncbi:MAG: hypothetical protein CO001_02275 [Candidatus Portnoybacteria bacterium CG_4_8_14_3_um_filter_40_10]|uniref:Ppx/GppA phosphatase N-terminal domain-containing protein n=1 Tax=Candidatus Portnoybacteria bacterium CG_4_8_14_3_um_filter_40_10 TaxID=1974801 RepID=A0A2M7IID2_9BACT|nr:MAG: hypothetical protein CO001_02275 [Candidatus Portnoybacteria bacterium CG_4_8_14_3_um_filter_40_10]
MSKILIDIGSSTIKVYKCTTEKLNLLVQRSIPFKGDFDPEGGISASAKKELFELIDTVKEENKESQIRIYATGIFRKLINETRVSFIDEFFERTGLLFNVINQDLENFYLEMSLVGKCPLNEPILLMNIGGGSTELIVMYGREAVERKNIDLGVGAVNIKFPQINEYTSKISLQEVVGFVKENLPVLSNKTKIAFYTGGELNYMQLAGYVLKPNRLFSDDDHPSLISTVNFSKHNKEIFEKVSLKELESLMPDNPKWMHGARGCSAIAQAICQKYSVQTIIPSNSNIINGIIRQEFRYVTISGSFRKHLEYILKIKGKLEVQGTKVLSPKFTEPKNPGERFVVFAGEEGLGPLELERHHLKSIFESDALIVCDPEGYVGASALLEIGFANAIGRRVIFVEKPEEFILNTLPCEIGL